MALEDERHCLTLDTHPRKVANHFRVELVNRRKWGGGGLLTGSWCKGGEESVPLKDVTSNSGVTDGIAAVLMDL